ncbi:hypothetical protein VE03_09662 [Pseudogymnoascus sp. 23342-1-I1]|nr:hypothetical protein VE03_09662 [Pseudogymnoascus sp. 23342-1-I1]
MDHVQDNGSLRGNDNYSHELGQQMNNYIVDPSLIDQTQWMQQQQPAQYAEDIFNPQQVYQQHPHSHQHQLSHQHPQQIQQQQYIQPAQSPFNYSASPSSVFQTSQYPGVYGQEPLRSNSSLGHYGVQYGTYPGTSQSPIQQMSQQMPQQVPQQIPHQSHQQYAPNQGQYSYSPQPQVPTTISPHDLDRAVQYPAPVPSRNTLTPQPVPSNAAAQNFRQSWTSEPEFQEQPIPVSTPVPQYHAALEPQQLQHIQSRPVVSQHAAISPAPALPPVAASQPEPVAQHSPASQPIPSQPIPSVSEAAQKYATAQIRVTRPELLAETKDIPSRRFSNAPWAILGVGSIELDNKYSSKALPVWQGRPNRSGKQLVPGLEQKLSATPTSKPKKIRTPKKYASERRSNLLKKEERLPRPLSSISVGGGEVGLRPPSLSPVESSEEEYTSSEDESEYSDEEEELGDMRTLDEASDIRPEPRPTDVAEAASWDALGIMYSPPGRRATTEEKMRVAMEFHPFVTGLREELVKVTADLAKAEAEKRESDVKTLKVERAMRQQAIVNALNTAITKGHQDLKDTLATHDKFVVGLTNILRNCIKADDYLGDLALAVFHLMSSFTKASEAVLTRSKFEGIVKKFNKNRIENKNVDVEGKRRQEDIKHFVETITKNTVEAQDRAIMAAADDSAKRGEQKEAITRPGEKESKPILPGDPRAVTQPASSLKRPYEPDSTSNSPNKKIASEGAKGLPAKPSGNKVPIKATGFFAKLGKQGPKAAPAPTPTPAVKPPAKKPAPFTGPSTLSMLLADISKPKEIPKAPEAPKRPDETPEQKVRRERKESRRHLRVHFKEGDKLTDVRIFTHERSEDEGRQGEMLRDAHDDRSEGMMHKQRFQGVADVDDEESEAEVNNKPWPVLSEVDFSNLGEGYYGQAFTSRGGPVEFETPQQRIQTKREDTELMVVYTDVSDIPHSPKEPPPSEPTTTTDTAVLHLRQPTNFPKTQKRLLDIRLHGADAAMARLFRNEDEERRGIHGEMTRRRAAAILGLTTPNPTVPEMLIAIANSPRFPKKDTAPPEKSLEQNIATLAELQAGTPTSVLFPPTVQQPQPHYPAPPGMDPADWESLSAVFASKTGLPFPAVEAPDWMIPAAQRVWHETLLKELIAKAGRERVFEERQVKEVQGGGDLMSQLQKIMGGQGGQQPQQQQEVQAQAEYDPSDLQNVLAGLGYPQGSQQQQQWPSQAQGVANYPAAGGATQQQYQQDQPAWLASMYASLQQPAAAAPPPPPTTSWNAPGQQQQQQASSSGVPSWQSSYGQRDGQDDGGGGGKKSWDSGGGGGGGGGKFNKNRLDPDYKRGTKPCRFWQEGKCAKGANCTFIHEQ